MEQNIHTLCLNAEEVYWKYCSNNEYKQITRLTLSLVVCVTEDEAMRLHSLSHTLPIVNASALLCLYVMGCLGLRGTVKSKMFYVFF